MPGPAAAAGAKAAAAAAGKGAASGAGARAAAASGGAARSSAGAAKGAAHGRGGGGSLGGLVGYRPRRGGGDDGDRATKALFAVLAFVLGLVVLVLAPLLIFVGATQGSTCGGGAAVSGRYELRGSDPPDLPAIEIASRIYLVGGDMGFERREVLTAFTVALVESGGGVTMRNEYGGDRDSVGVFQQRNFAPWNERNRLNVAAAATTFYEQLRVFDRGQSIGELAADVQRPAAQYRYRYAAALPEAERFYVRVEASLATNSTPTAGLSTDGATCASATGPAKLRQAVTLHAPRRFARVPAQWTAYGQAEYVDERILANVVYVARRYELRVTQGRGGYPPSVSHGYGTAVDLVPAPGSGWDETALAAAEDLGWSRECGSSGVRPTCDLVPAIRFVGYDGYPNHGRGNHLHLSWEGSASSYTGALLPPMAWVKAFPSPGTSQESDAG